MKKIGFMFGAGAEISYGLPSSGEFALNIFRQDLSESKNIFENQRKSVGGDKNYEKWLPDNFSSKRVTPFSIKSFEDIIKSTIEQNKDKIILCLNNLDSTAEKIISEKKQELGDINDAFKAINEIDVSNSSMNETVSYVSEFDDGDGLFKSHYFSAILIAYKKFKIKKLDEEKKELGKIIISILQLQVASLGAKFVNRLNEMVFSKKDNEIDIFDEIGDILQLNYQFAGLSGFKYLLNLQKPNLKKTEGRILRFAQILLEKIYETVLDYKAFIDSNWMYLYYPSSNWSKFCKISIFLLSVRNYLDNTIPKLQSKRKGYYDDVYEAIQSKKFEICGVATSNYSTLIHSKLQTDNIAYLNGSVELWYDPYLNRIGKMNDLKQSKHFIVPLMFTQSGTKPMTSVEVSISYVEYYKALCEADEICVIGYGFNSDDDHINGIFRELVDRKNKSLIIVTVKDKFLSEEIKREEILRNLRIQNGSKIKILFVDNERKIQEKLWIDHIIE